MQATLQNALRPQRVVAPSAALETSRAYFCSATPANGLTGGS
jgi:hypothetical protein